MLETNTQQNLLTNLFEVDYKLGSVIADLEDLTINKNRSVNIHEVLQEITQTQEIIRDFLSKNIKIQKK